MMEFSFSATRPPSKGPPSSHWWSPEGPGVDHVTTPLIGRAPPGSTGFSQSHVPRDFSPSPTCLPDPIQFDHNPHDHHESRLPPLSSSAVVLSFSSYDPHCYTSPSGQVEIRCDEARRVHSFDHFSNSAIPQMGFIVSNI